MYSPNEPFMISEDDQKQKRYPLLLLLAPQFHCLQVRLWAFTHTAIVDNLLITKVYERKRVLTQRL